MDFQEENKTGTELEVLKNIEKSWYRHNPEARRRHTERSLKWFQRYITRNYHRTKPQELHTDTKLHTTFPIVGYMYFFKYDAILKDVLPVWDKYPLIFPFDRYRDEETNHEYLLGINLHYLPPKLRFEAMKALLTLRNEKRYRDSTRLLISWNILKHLSNSHFYRHSVKKYRMDHIQSKFVKIPSQSWEMALYLPLAEWQNDNKHRAWRIEV